MREANGTLIFFIIALIVCLGFALQSNYHLKKQVVSLENSVALQQKALLKYADLSKQSTIKANDARRYLNENDGDFIKHFNSINHLLIAQ